VNGESISLRLLSRTEQHFGFDRLDLSEKQAKIIRHLLAQPNGIILLTGPTAAENPLRFIVFSAASIPSSAGSSRSKNRWNIACPGSRRST